LSGEAGQVDGLDPGVGLDGLVEAGEEVEEGGLVDPGGFEDGRVGENEAAVARLGAALGKDDGEC
jgi:hypothetical protein